MFKKLTSNHLIKDSFLYTLFGGLNGLIPFILLPILTSYLNPEEYGIATLFKTTLLLIYPLIGLSMGFYIDKNFFKVSKVNLSKQIGNIFIIQLILLFFFTIIFFLISLVYNLDIFGLPVNWLILCPLVCFIFTFNEYNLIILRNQSRAINYGYWQSAHTIFNMSLSLFFVISLSYGWQGRVLGIVIAQAIIGIASFIKILNSGFIKIKFDKNEIKEILLLCFPLLLHGLSTYIIFQSNFYFIKMNVSLNAVGVFSVAIAFSSIMGIIKDGLAKTINPWIYKNLNTISDVNLLKVKLRKLFTILILVLLILNFFITIFSRIIIQHLIDPKYLEASNLVFILIGAISIYVLYGILCSIYIHFSKTYLLSKITFYTAIISICLNYFLTYKFGIIGACYALFFCMLFQLVTTFYYSTFFFNLLPTYLTKKK